MFTSNFLKFFFVLSVSVTLVLSEDPDVYRNVVQFITSRGFEAETHYVTTDDGYILTIHRIVNAHSKVKNKRPIILQHGLFSSGIDWIINSPGLGTEASTTIIRNLTVSNNLGFALSLFGYDVWLTNSRGNAYGINHTALDPHKDAVFWNFSFDEMIEFDLPATINYILKATKHSNLGYIGHSQGTLIMFGLLSKKPQYSKIIKPFIALAPVASVANIKSPIRYLLENPLIMDYFYYEGGPFLPKHHLLNFIGESVCNFALFGELCSNVLFLFAGFDSQQLNRTRIPVYMAHTPSGTSSWNLVHYGQGIQSKMFRKFDYGSKNKEKYGQETPPPYDLKNIKSKYIAILHSRNDWLATPKDVNFLRKEIRGNILLDYKIPDNDWNHLDFIWGRNVAKYVNSIVLDILDQFQSKSEPPSCP